MNRYIYSRHKGERTGIWETEGDGDEALVPKISQERARTKRSPTKPTATIRNTSKRTTAKKQKMPTLQNGQKQKQKHTKSTQQTIAEPSHDLVRTTRKNNLSVNDNVGQKRQKWQGQKFLQKKARKTILQNGGGKTSTSEKKTQPTISAPTDNIC